MTIVSRVAVLGLVASLLAGCSGMTTREQRTLSGGAIGAAGGTIVSAIVGGPLWLGAVLGGAGGATIGAVTSPHR
jgi:hypothetical protein